MRKPIQWYGGKTPQLPKLLQYIPHHKIYCELFGGSATLLFAKSPASLEIYNDIDKDLFNFFNVLRDPIKFKKFYRLVLLTPYSRAEFQYAKDTYENTSDNVEKAYKFFIIVRQSFNSLKRNWGCSVNTYLRAKAVRAYLSIINLLPQIHQRIMNVQIECLDFREMFQKYISKWNYDTAFVYCDPPYVANTRVQKNEYKYEMSDEDHYELVKSLLKYNKNSKFMLSGYDNELYKELEKNGWGKITWKTHCWAGNPSKRPERTECIWINYDTENNTLKLK